MTTTERWSYRAGRYEPVDLDTPPDAPFPCVGVATIDLETVWLMHPDFVADPHAAAWAAASILKVELERGIDPPPMPRLVTGWTDPRFGATAWLGRERDGGAVVVVVLAGRDRLRKYRTTLPVASPLPWRQAMIDRLVG